MGPRGGGLSTVQADSPSLGCSLFNQLSYRFLDAAELADGVDAAVELVVTDDVRGPAGPVHAGVIALLADVAGAMAVVARTDRVGATAAVAVHNLATAKVGPLRANATLLQASSTRAVADVKVLDVGMDDRLVAAGHITLGLFAAKDG
ncbi:MAG: PaaI family thioesterase [Acidimicrobiales bacterium]|nr:PaaI family thioesterase [Acidimicrobiales bacterium]